MYIKCTFTLLLYGLFRFLLKMYRQIESQRFHSPASKHALIFFLFSYIYVSFFI